MSNSGKMKFQRFGRSSHLCINSAADLALVCELDEAHWVATAAPIDMLNADATFLSLVDSDGNGRILCFELRDAIAWLLANLLDTSGVDAGSDTLWLDAVDTESPAGAKVLLAAGEILQDIGEGQSDSVTLGQVRKAKAAALKSPVSESGVVIPSAAGDEGLRRFINDIIKTVGGESHPTGSPGVGRAKLAEFLAQAKSYLAWQAAGGAAEGKPQTAVEPLGVEKLSQYREKGEDGKNFRAALLELIDSGSQTAAMLDGIRLVEKLTLYQANLLTLANNFVSFPHLYDPASRAMFESGSLVMDGRRFNFAVRVQEHASHAAVAKNGNTCVIYVEVSPPGGAERYEVAVPVTSGNKGGLCVGKRGIFEDISGRQCDARIVEIIDNPVSVPEAIVSPFKRLGRMLSGKIEAITASGQKQFDAKTSAVVNQAGGTPAPAPQPQPTTNKGLLAGGLLMGGGVAIAALGSAMAYIGNTLATDSGRFTFLVVVIGVILSVIIPTAIVAILKLRRRDFSAILEGSRWAINVRMRLTRKQGRAFTQKPKR